MQKLILTKGNSANINKRYSFIFEDCYKNISGHNVTSTEIIEFLFKTENRTHDSIKKNLSTMTRARVVMFDQVMQSIFGDYSNIEHYSDLNDMELGYVKDEVREDLSYSIDGECSASGESIGKYYEIVSHADSSGFKRLIVVKEYFLEVLLEDISNLLTFILDCMRLSFSGDEFDLSLFELYTNLKIDSSYFNLIKLKIESSLPK